MENSIKSTIVNINYEIDDNFKINKNNIGHFIEELKDVLDFYKFTIYKNAKKSIYSKLNLKINDVNNENDLFIENFNFDEFLNKLSCKLKNSNLDNKDILDDIKLIVNGECIKLFKFSQIQTCKILNIKTIKIISNTNCCDICKVQSKISLDVNKIIYNDIHPYCKFIIIPNYNKNKINISNKICTITHLPIEYNGIVNKLLLNLTIHYKDFITKKEFIFSDNINNINISGDTIKISNKILDVIDIEKIIIKNLIKDNLLTKINITEWDSIFKMKKDSKLKGDNYIIYTLPFVNTNAQYDCENYIIENAVQYILNKDELSIIDNNAFNKLKDIFEK